MGSVRPKAGWLLALVLVAAGCGSQGPSQLLLLITVDTLRADRLGVHGNEQGLTPNLDALAANSEVFTTAYAPASFTLPSIATLQTGHYPAQLSLVNNVLMLPETAPTLAQTLRERGWKTGAVVSNFVLRSETGLDAGFDLYDDRLPHVEANRADFPERLAPATTEATLAALDELSVEGKPVFLWVHYQDPHGPYVPPEPRRQRHLAQARAAADGARELPASEQDWGLGAIPRYQVRGEHRDVAFYRAGYDGEVEYTDEEIGRLLAGVSERELMDRAIVIFTADHGEGMGERDYWFAHGEFLTDPLVQVPLLVRVPERAAARRVDAAGLVDVYPTVLALLGIETPDRYPGRDLLAPHAESGSSSLILATLDGSTTPRIGLIEDGYKYIYEPRRDGSFGEELFRLGREDRDLSAEQPERANAMRTRLRDRWHALLVSKAATRPQDLTPAEAKRLEALGYRVDK
jgi:arylsulfatase A-like enzyme